MANEYERLTKILGYQFKDEGLLKMALSHRSVGRVNNERIEFLGDSIVNFVIAEALYKIFPKASEGELSRLRASIVKGEALAILAQQLTIGDYLKLGQGELKAGGHKRPSILAGAMEAVIGAIYMDADFETCKACILDWHKEILTKIDLKHQLIDAKTRLQEYLQGKRHDLPQYEVVDVIGKAHDQIFVVHCFVAMLKKPVEGRGTSRRKAEQAAAENTLEAIKNDKN